MKELFEIKLPSITCSSPRGCSAQGRGHRKMAGVAAVVLNLPWEGRYGHNPTEAGRRWVLPL